ncbi:MAG: thermonuclease family protein [Alphaproteobacteria bacterium]|nr:thermonuclease family protein [Alphaproteobacteria bacterium]
MPDLRFVFRFFAFLMLFAVVPHSLCFAQTSSTAENEGIRVQARASEANILVSGSYKIRLWGVDAFEGNSALLKLKSRTALDDKISNKPIQCQIKEKQDRTVYAQCVNTNEEDLSLFMIQQGYVSVDRAAVYGTIFEKPYIDAEALAQKSQRGIWAENGVRAEAETPFGQGFVIGSVVFLIVVVLALGGISVFIMRGFRRVVDIQNQSIDLAARERSLRSKEKFVIASMLDAEIRTNKTKIEAYITIYEEMLSDFKNTAVEPKYRRSGDIVQKQPALNRSVFDGNTDKLDLLGRKTASDIIHYYARIKTIPDYVTLEPEMPLERARGVVAQAIENAKKLDALSTTILGEFAARSLVETPDI